MQQTDGYSIASSATNNNALGTSMPSALAVSAVPMGENIAYPHVRTLRMRRSIPTSWLELPGERKQMLRVDFTSQDYLRDPAAGLTKLRSAGPVVEVRFPIVGKTWISRNWSWPCHRTLFAGGSGLASGHSKSFPSRSTSNDLPFRGRLSRHVRVGQSRWLRDLRLFRSPSKSGAIADIAASTLRARTGLLHCNKNSDHLVGAGFPRSLNRACRLRGAR